MARRIPSEIVCVDSMQLYRGMDIGTGKPEEALRREVLHHGIDLADPEEEFNIARYAALIRPEIEAIRSRQRFPILVGGSGLYVRALLEGLSPAPGEDRVLREQLIAQAKTEGSHILHARLKEVDPVASERIHSNDVRRIVRALEVYLSTGQPFTQWHKESKLSSEKGEGDCLFFGLTCKRELLYQRIEERIDGWLARGWLEEARALSRRQLSRTAREALGYRELFAYLDGSTDWESTVKQIKQHTRWYAKRQETWFRKGPKPIRWIDVEEKSAEATTEVVMGHFLSGKRID